MISIVTAVMMFSTSGIAAECQGVTYPEKAEVGGTELLLNGLGLREATVFKVDVYVAALYVIKRSSSGETILNSPEPKKLVLKFVRDVSKDEISNAWSEGFEKTAKENFGKLKERIAKLNSWMVELTSGSTLTFNYESKSDRNSSIEVNVNGKRQGGISGNDFAKAFLAIWLGPDPPNDGLKSGLLGGSCD